MRKRDELTDPSSCMSKACDDELTFVLLGRDAAAPATIRAWVAERLRCGKNEPGDAQIIEAEACARAMEAERGSPGPAVVAADPADWEPWACDAQRAAEAKAIADYRAGLTEPMDSLMGEGGAGAVTGTVTSLEPTELGWEAVILCRMARDAGFALDSRVGDRVSVASLPPGPDGREGERSEA